MKGYRLLKNSIKGPVTITITIVLRSLNNGRHKNVKFHFCPRNRIILINGSDIS